MPDAREDLTIASPAEAARGWLRACIDLLYPPICSICTRPLVGSERTVCLICRAVLAPEPDWRCPQCAATGQGEGPTTTDRCRLCPPSDAAYQGVLAVTGYFAESARAVHLFKYDRRLELGHVMAGVMCEKLTPPIQHLGARLDLITPVPLHWLRRATRGFNQSRLLARALAQATHLPFDERLLRRRRNTRRQALVPREQRAANVRDAFALRPARDVRGKGILLIDDVVTTGHTIHECAKVLHAAGAREVWIAAFARAKTGLGRAERD